MPHAVLQGHTSILRLPADPQKNDLALKLVVSVKVLIE
jgi:hypothetical protein